jgi:dTDP-4-amino-4,6-dideoxygalactose transaminase
MITMKVPFFDYPQLWNKERKELMSIIDATSSNGSFILQSELEDFENQLAEYTGSKFAVGVGNATDAMEIFLQAIGLQEGDEVIISSHTMLATASSIIHAGGVPVPVDIGPDNLIDPESIENAINNKTVGIMPTQLNGRTCDMDAINKIATKNKLFLVEDSAQALGSKYKERFAGTFGIASCISFFPAKVLGCFGDAGAILCQDPDIFEKCYQIHDHGRNKNGDVICWGRNSRLDNVQAAILSYKLNKYEKVIQRRREIATMYHEQLSELDELILPPPPEDESNNFDVYQNYELVAKSRDELKENLLMNGIGTLIQWGGMAIHHFRDLGFNQKLPKTDAFFEGCIMLPMNMFISNADVDYVCDSIKKFYRS